MILNRLLLKNFGRFSGKEIRLEEGINIIYGANESGKSTIHTFIQGIFFGMKRMRGKASKTDDFIHYTPWENSGWYEGAVTFTCAGKRFCLERNFAAGSRGVRLYCESDGEVLSVEDGDLEMLLGGISETVFRNTVSAGQMKSRTEEGLLLELRDAVSSWQGSGDLQINPEKALEILKGKRKVWEGRQQELIQKRSQEEEKLKNRLEYQQQEADRLSGRIREYQEQYTQARQAAAQAQQRIERERQKRQQAERNGQLQQSSERERRARQSSEGERQPHPQKKRGRQAQNRGQRYLLYAALILFAAGFVLTREVPFLIVLTTVPLAASVLGKIQNRRQRYLLYAALILSMAVPVLIIDPLFLIPLAVVALAMAVLELAPYLREKSRTDSQEASPEEIDRQKREQASRWEQEAGQWSARAQKLGGQLEILRSQLLERQTEISNLKEEYEEFQGDYEQQLSVKKEIDSITLAEKRIRELSAKLKNSTGTVLRQEMSRILSGITGGRYRQVVIDDAFQISLYTGERLVPLYQASSGTAEQVYLALRMASAGILCREEELPVLLDETLAFYDDKRLLETLSWLAREKSQVLLFSCTRREIEALRGHGIPCNVIEL